MASYTYDSASRRHSKTIPNGTVTTYCYDAGGLPNVLVDYEDGVWVRAFVYGPGVDEPLCMIEPDGDIYYYHQDGLGSVVALSGSAGELAERYYYDVFGQPDQPSNLENPYLFTGRRYDSESGLYYYRARMYHPELGRFLQTDSIGYEDGINWYGYCKNNPGNWSDPSGLSLKSWWRKYSGVVGFGLGVAADLAGYVLLSSALISSPIAWGVFVVGTAVMVASAYEMYLAPPFECLEGPGKKHGEAERRDVPDDPEDPYGIPGGVHPGLPGGGRPSPINDVRG